MAIVLQLQRSMVAHSKPGSPFHVPRSMPHAPTIMVNMPELAVRPVPVAAPADCVQLHLPRQMPRGSAPALPIRYPTMHTPPRSRLAMFVLGMFFALFTFSVVCIARPAVLDAACDRYDWFGSSTASTLRDGARAAHTFLLGT